MFGSTSVLHVVQSDVPVQPHNWSKNTVINNFNDLDISVMYGKFAWQLIHCTRSMPAGHWRAFSTKGIGIDSNLLPFVRGNHPRSSDNRYSKDPGGKNRISLVTPPSDHLDSLGHYYLSIYMFDRHAQQLVEWGMRRSVSAPKGADKNVFRMASVHLRYENRYFMFLERLHWNHHKNTAKNTKSKEGDWNDESKEGRFFPIATSIFSDDDNIWLGHTPVLCLTIHPTILNWNMFFEE